MILAYNNTLTPEISRVRSERRCRGFDMFAPEEHTKEVFQCGNRDPPQSSQKTGGFPAHRGKGQRRNVVERKPDLEAVQ